MIVRRDVALIALLLLISVVALAQSWNRWLDPIIDTGRDLYISERLFHGTKLYRDIRYQYPPLAPYTLAGLTAVAGSSLAAFAWIGIAQSAALAALLWLALRNMAGFVAALLFVALSFTGASTWGANFVFPYAYAATIGVLLLAGALAAFVYRHNAVAIALLVCASWCKIEYAAAAALIVCILALARRLRIVDGIAYAAAMLVTALAAVLYFGDALRQNIFATSLTQGAIAQRFFRNVSGLDAWPRNLGIAVASAVAVALIGWLLQRRSFLAVPAVVLGAIAFNSDSFFRGWALLQVVALIVALRRPNSPLIFFAAFSVASTLRVVLNVSPQWYGCALVVPVYALSAYVLFADERTRSNWWLLLVAAICARDLFEQRERYALKTFPIQSTRGVIYDANGDRAAILTDLIQSVRGPTLAVFPEGVTLNYLTRKATPLHFYMFTPPETADPSVESEVLADLRAGHPDELAIVSRDVTEYGFHGFGSDYDRKIAAYLIQNYRPYKRWERPNFQAVLLRNLSR